jgi:hypothetical protein
MTGGYLILQIASELGRVSPNREERMKKRHAEEQIVKILEAVEATGSQRKPAGSTA